MARHLHFNNIENFANFALESLIEAIDVDVEVSTKDVWNILCVSALTEIPWNLLSTICDIPDMGERLAEYINQDPENAANVLELVRKAQDIENIMFDDICSISEGIMWEISNFSPTLNLVVTCYMYTDKYLAIKEYCDPSNSIVVSRLLREMFENTPAVLRNSNIIDAKAARYWGML